VEFIYDYMGRRVQKKVYSFISDLWSLTSDTLFIYDGWNVIQQMNGTGEVQKAYVYGMDLSQSLQGAGGVGGLLSVVDSGDAYDYLYDANGNVGQLVNALDGSIAAHYEYDPFGILLKSSGSMADENPFRFSTKYYDVETDIYYYGYRYYSTSLGRWINRDPLEEGVGINLYAFGGNSPVNGIDPLGDAWNRWRALWHYSFGGGRDVSLTEVGHYKTVSNSLKPQMNSWKLSAQKSTENAAKILNCPNITLTSTMNADHVSAHSGVWWIAGLTLYRKYFCAITADCTKCIYSYSCNLEFDINDPFKEIFDIDNSGNDPWDKWEPGTVFSVKDHLIDVNYFFCQRQLKFPDYHYSINHL